MIELVRSVTCAQPTSQRIVATASAVSARRCARQEPDDADTSRTAGKIKRCSWSKVIGQRLARQFAAFGDDRFKMRSRREALSRSLPRRVQYRVVNDGILRCSNNLVSKHLMLPRKEFSFEAWSSDLDLPTE